jgi:hypothetical protein
MERILLLMEERWYFEREMLWPRYRCAFDMASKLRGWSERRSDAYSDMNQHS